MLVAREVSGQVVLGDWGREWTGHAFTRGYGGCVFWMCWAGWNDLPWAMRRLRSRWACASGHFVAGETGIARKVRAGCWTFACDDHRTARQCVLGGHRADSDRHALQVFLQALRRNDDFLE